MRILGIDPGYGILGWAVIESNRLFVDCGIIETSSDSPIDDRLLEIHYALQRIIETYRPDQAALERIFFTKNRQTGIDVAKAVGVIVLTMKLNNLSYAEYTPSQVKQALTGYGRADKPQMKRMIRAVFNLPALPSPDDAADALAVALCHSFKVT